MFIAFEGGEGAGKSTQVRRLADALAARGLDVRTTREPGGTPAGRRIRELLLDRASDGLSPRAEALLYAADRAEHVAAVIRPALAGGAVVITDRYVDSSLAYQGAGRTLAIADVARLSEWATEGLVPDLTVVLDLDPEVGLARAGDPDRLEAEPLDFHRRVRQGFLDLAAAAPARYAVIDASRDPDEVFADVAAAVLATLTPSRRP
ncbi:MAG TPA: dTMP kinase [Actinomycetes bacterium]|nr:dTMP kinase [Actinomycetes bacterium]